MNSLRSYDYRFLSLRRLRRLQYKIDYYCTLRPLSLFQLINYYVRWLSKLVYKCTSPLFFLQRFSLHRYTYSHSTPWFIVFFSRKERQRIRGRGSQHGRGVTLDFVFAGIRVAHPDNGKKARRVSAHGCSMSLNSPNMRRRICQVKSESFYRHQLLIVTKYYSP